MSFILGQAIDPWIRIVICNEGTGIILSQNCVQIHEVRNEVHLMINVDYNLLMSHQSIAMIEIIDRYKINKLSSEASNGIKKEIPIVWSFLKFSENNLTEGFAISARLNVFKYQTDSWYIKRCTTSLGVPRSAPQVYVQYLRKKFVPAKGSVSVYVDPTFQSEVNSNQCDDDTIDQVPPSNEYDEGAINDIVPKTLVHRFHSGGATVLGFSHSGSHLALVTNQNRMHIYELDNGSEIYRAPYPHQNYVHVLVWTEDDNMICCASKDGTISTYCLEESNHWKTMKFITLGLERSPISLSNMHCNPYILIGGSDGTVTIFDLCKSQDVKVLEGHEHKVTAMTTSIAQHENGNSNLDELEISLFSGDEAGVVIFWRIKCLPYTSHDQFEIQILRKLTNLPELRDKQISNLSVINSNQAVDDRKLLINAKDNVNSMFTYDLVCHVVEAFGVSLSIRNLSFAKTIFCLGGNFISGGTRDGRIILMDSDGIQMEVRKI
jgi:WD40 repeat protein